ncbi:MAG: tRNA (adenosine(37)-N6)-dimethylallyltransferase MiaA [Candidatus Paceibacterota bacterium]
MKKSVLVILGPTATGKSRLAVKLAKKFNGEIISADSRQVYKNLNIGSGKISEKDKRGIPHYLLDVAEPKHKFTVTEYKKLADEKIEQILLRDKVPILCGGTAFYIDAVTKGIIFPEVPPNKKLRAGLEKKSAEVLYNILKILDKRRAENIDIKNRVRIIRAIEIAKSLGKVPEQRQQKPKYKFIFVGLNLPNGELRKKISKRVDEMFKGGLLKEIKNLKKSGISDKRLREFGFEYFEPTPEKVINESIKYTKRQNTWWKKDKRIKWFSPKDFKMIESYISKELP